MLAETKGAAELSTPSLGITRQITTPSSAILQILSTPSLGITRQITTPSSAILQILSTPSLGITGSRAVGGA
jgi:hypothetical protein